MFSTKSRFQKKIAQRSYKWGNTGKVFKNLRTEKSILYKKSFSQIVILKIVSIG